MSSIGITCNADSTMVVEYRGGKREERERERERESPSRRTADSKQSI